jgi:VIT1/CCC1 family predicted Fe2+/Mn2+ transporter
MNNQENHKSHRIGWLRAAVLGANDGIVSTASLIIGVAAAHAAVDSILLAGVAGLSAGAMSMAAGEYVSVSSQSDTENADLLIEKNALENDADNELQELAEIYENRGLKPELAKEVAVQLMQHNALEAHARDELGITENSKSQPGQAAIFSAGSFSIGAALPLIVAWLVPQTLLIGTVAVSSLLFLSMLGALAAKAGGAPLLKGTVRVTMWGAFAMGVTAAVGQLFGVVA